MSEHTPGPWSIDKGPITGEMCVVSDDAWICGQLSNGNGMPYAEAYANARLIAAAPELLAMLEDVAKWVGGMCSCRHDDDYHDRLMATIAKARGEV